MWAKSRKYFARLSRTIIVLLFNALITKHSKCFISEKLETIFILPFFSQIHKMTIDYGQQILSGPCMTINFGWCYNVLNNIIIIVSGCEIH